MDHGAVRAAPCLPGDAWRRRRDLRPCAVAGGLRSPGIVRKVSHYVLAGLDGPPAEPAVLAVAAVMGEVLGLPVRSVHVAPGPGLRGEARRSALARVQRGESTEVPGRPEDVLTSLVEAPGTDLAVLGARQRPRRPGGRRAAGTAIAVARRVTQPLLLVPPGAERWCGPRRVLTPLDGTGITAMTAASALAAISRPDTVGIPLHVVDESSAHRFWGGPADEADAWRREFHTRCATDLADPPSVHTGPVGQQVLKGVAATESDLVVLVWSRRTRGGHGAAVLDVLASSPVPVLLVPVHVPA